jgi:hypothetical protein
MSRTLSVIRQNVRHILRDEFDVDESQEFDDDEIDAHVLHCLDQISDARPYEIDEIVIPVDHSRIVDISSIERLIKIEYAEYPLGSYPQNFRNVKRIDSETVEVLITSPFSDGASGTLTGTVTFTSGSGTVTGSGTAFTTELGANYLIKKSTGTRYYRVYSVESDTSLTLSEPVRSADNGADTVDVTAYAYRPVILHCWKRHELTDESSTLEEDCERVLIDGSVGYTALSWISDIREHVKETITLVGSMETAIGSMTERIEQAVIDLDSSRDLQNQVLIGYDEYRGVGSGELQSANTYLNQAKGYQSAGNSRMAIASMINAYQVFANGRIAIYNRGLKSITKRRVKRIYSMD